ncbi:MAG TPA: hypothetical protein PLH97_14520 [Verrucomicrobiota bacterium]|nr:hypothetical protein [Verrucomicrobiota bacterium]
MDLPNLILNIASLLLWLNWRSIRLDPIRNSRPATLVGTLRRAEPMTLRRWHLLGGLLLLLYARAFLYEQLGPAVNWTPRLNLGVVVLAFRADQFRHELLFSVLSFARALLILQTWFLVLVLIHRRNTEDPFHKLLQQQLGRVARWPAWLQALLPGLLAASLWLACHPLLATVGVINWPDSGAQLAAQAAILAGAIYLSLQHLLIAVLVLYLVNSYVYLGNNPVWDYINYTGRTLLAPLRRFKLRFRKVDLEPLAGMGIVLLLFNSLDIARYFWPDAVAQWLLWPQ